MEFVLWACRSMHLFSVVVWLGGLMFQNAVAAPVLQAEGEAARPALRKINRRFIGFIWMSAWTMGVTGVILLLASPRFLWFQFHDRWSLVVGLKQIVFLFMLAYSFGYARMVRYLDAPASNGGYDAKSDLYRRRVEQYRKITLALGILGLLLAAAM